MSRSLFNYSTFILTSYFEYYRNWQRHIALLAYGIAQMSSQGALTQMWDDRSLFPFIRSSIIWQTFNKRFYVRRSLHRRRICMPFVINEAYWSCFYASHRLFCGAIHLYLSFHFFFRNYNSEKLICNLILLLW